MLACTYTKDKVKKTKSWKDGFLALKDKKLILYDEDKKQIYAFVYKNLGEEIITPAYLIYCEDLVKASAESEDEVKIEKPIEKTVTNSKMQYKKNEYQSQAAVRPSKAINVKIEVTKRSRREVLELIAGATIQANEEE